MVLWKLTLREVRLRPGRALLTLLSIIIGVAAVVAVALATTATREAYQTMYESVAGHAALEVAAEGGGGFPDSVAASLKDIPGVKAVEPSFQTLTVLYHQGARQRMLAMGVDPASTRLNSVIDFGLPKRLCAAAKGSNTVSPWRKPAAPRGASKPTTFTAVTPRFVNSFT